MKKHNDKQTEKNLNAKVFARRFKTLVYDNNTDMKTLMNVTGIKSNSTLYRYLNGIMTPRIPTIKIIAQYYNINPLWLMGESDNKEIPYNYDKHNVDIFGNRIAKIPILGTIKAGYNYYANENWIDTIDLCISDSNASDYFALKVTGDSMYPYFLENDIVILKKQNYCEDKEIAAVLIGGEECTLKLVRKIEDGIILKALNEDSYDPVFFSNKDIVEKPISIIGVYYESRRKDIKL